MWFNNTPKQCNIHQKTFINAKQITDIYTRQTPLISLSNIGQDNKQKILLKDETKQHSGSFKLRGVSYIVHKAFQDMDNSGISLITQSTGNHGIAILYTIRKILEMNLSNNVYKSVIPVIYGTKDIKPSKLVVMRDELDKIRILMKDKKRGILDFTFNTYAEAKEARLEYMKQHESIYLSHGSRDTFIGHGTMGVELNEQLNALQIPQDAKISIILSCGAGGIIGIGACLSAIRGIHNVNVIITQTDDQDAFVRSLMKGKIQYNNKPRLDFADGIAVDAPEKYALYTACKCVTAADIVSHEYCQDVLLPVVRSCIKENIPIGGTTVMGFATLEKKINCVQNSDVVIVVACEGHI